MSSAAKFLLEFEARGDQEVVNKIRAVGQAGTEAATELQGLQGIEDPFAAIGEGADAAIAPIEGVGTAAETALTPIEELGTATADSVSIMTGAGTAASDYSANLDAVGGAADAATGGITPFNTLVGKVGGTTASTTESLGSFLGGITAIGGVVGSTVSSIFSLSNAQLRLDKANLRAAKSAETARKAEVAFDTLIKGAGANRDALTAAQEKLNQMQEAGITSGAEYEAAQRGVEAATAALRASFVAGGGDAAKFDAALNKLNLSTETASVNQRAADKAAAEYNQTLIENAFNVAALAGTTLQVISGFKNFKGGAEALGKSLKGLLGISGTGGLLGVLSKIPPAVAGAAGAFLAFPAIMAALDRDVGGASTTLKNFTDQLKKDVPALSPLIDFFAKNFQSNVTGIGGMVNALLEKLGLIPPKAKEVGDSAAAAAKGTTELGAASKATAADLEAAVKAANGNTEAFESLQRTHASAKVGLEDFNAAERDTAGVTADLSDEMKTFETALFDVESAMTKSVGSATALTNLFPEMGSNIQNALLGQKQGMDIAIQLWNDFNARVQDGQYEIGEFSKYIQDMGYELGPAIQSGVDAIDAIQQKIEEAKGTIPGFIDEVTAAITQGNAEYFESGQALEDNLSKSELAVRALQEETVKEKDAFLGAKDAAEQFSKSLVDQGAKLQGEIDAMREVSNQTQGITNAKLAVTKAYEESNQKLRESNAIMADQGKISEIVQTAINEEIVALNEEAIALEERNAIAENAVIQDKRLAIAKAEGLVSAKEFIAALDEEVAQQQAYDAALRKTVRELGSYGSAQVQSTEQLEQFLQVAAGSPAALSRLADALGGLAQSATKFVENTGDEDELFGDWEISDKVPDEIRDMMSDADARFIAGRAQLERSLEYLGPLFGVKAAQALQQGGEKGLASLRTFGNQAADIVRGSVHTMTPAVQELATSFDALGEPGEQTIDSLQRVVTAMENAESPAADLRLAMADLAVQSGTGAEQVAAMAGGLDLLRSSSEAAGKPLKNVTLSLSEMDTTTIVDDMGNVVKKLVEVNGQMIEVPTNAGGAAGGMNQLSSSLNPLNTAIQAAGASLTQFQTYLSEFKIEIPAVTTNPLAPMISAMVASLGQFATTATQKLNVVSTSALTMRNNFNAAASGAAAAMGRAGAAAGSFASKATSSFNAAGRSALTARNNVNAMASGISSACSKAGSAANRFAGQFASAMNRVKSSASSARSAVNSLASSINKLKSKTITITTRYVTSGTPPRSAQAGMHETLAADTVIQAHKGERVDIGPGSGTTTNIVRNIYGAARDTTVSVPVFLDGKLLTRIVRRHLAEDVTGGM